MFHPDLFKILVSQMWLWSMELENKQARTPILSRLVTISRFSKGRQSPHTPRQNRAKVSIGEVKKWWRNKMHSKGVLK